MWVPVRVSGWSVIDLLEWTVTFNFRSEIVFVKCELKFPRHERLGDELTEIQERFPERERE